MLSKPSLGRKIIGRVDERDFINTIMRDPIVTKPLLVNNKGQIVERDTGRVVHLNGINFASNAKLPHTPIQKTHFNPETCGFYGEGDSVSFTNRPFSLDDAYEHISRIKQCGYNTIRFVITWEAIEHEGPGIYDTDYVDYVIKLFQVIYEVGGIYVFIDPHQDVWSRYSGGSGAPMWTLYAAGLEPRNFKETLAAKLHHMCPDPSKFTKMVWATNYGRLASQVMFTLFYSGKIFAPKAMLNGKNIQDFLQDNFIEAFGYLMDRLKDRIPHIFDSCLLGVETMNEPNSGFFGFSDLNHCSESQKLKLDEFPTPIQAMRLGMGFPESVDTYSLTIFGPLKNGSKWIDPKGIRAWVTKEDNRDNVYGFKRSPYWELGKCIFGQHGVWDIHTGELIKPDYFKVHPETGEYLDEDKFINGPILTCWGKFRKRMRQVDENMFLILQPPVLQIPPRIENDLRYVDDKTMIALHYYDGMSLMFQKWNRIMNVDTLGIIRGRYINPIFGLNLGESNIRKSIRKQLKEMENESKNNAGYGIPVIFTETGMPFNMEEKRAYKSGCYDSQEAATDAILSGLESERLHFTFWCYNPENCHKWGDYWNLEDFSIYSNNENDKKVFIRGNSYKEWLDKNAGKSIGEYTPQTGSSADSDDAISIQASTASDDSNTTKLLLRESTKQYNGSGAQEPLELNLFGGIRALNSIVRPVVMATNGTVTVCEYNYLTKDFHLEVSSVVPKCDVYPDIITLPRCHYNNNNYSLNVSDGSVQVKGNHLLQWIEWDHSGVSSGNVTLDISINKEIPRNMRGSDALCGNLKELACGYV